MTLVIDAAPLVALADEREPLRAQIHKLLTTERRGLFIPAAVTAEVDYMLGQRFGRPAQRGLSR